MQTTKANIEQLIEVQKPDTFWTHFLGNFIYRKRKVGSINSEEVRLWQHIYEFPFLYAVFVFSFDKNNTLTQIQTRINSFAKIVLFIIFSAIISFFMYKNIQLFGNDRLWIYILIEIIFLSILIALIVKVYQYGKKTQLKAICEHLQIELNQKTTLKGQLGSVLLRTLTYPIGCIALYFSFAYFIPKEDWFKGIFGIVTVTAYFITDIILFFRNK